MRGHKRIPIKVAKDLAKSLDVSVTCIVTWDRDGVQHVVTWGKSKDECMWAADLGNVIKRDILKWPHELCGAIPKRAKS